MVSVIGVSFRSAGKVYYFSPGSYEVKHGDYVIVETARGVELGKVAMPLKEVEEESVTQPLRTIIRVATKEDKEKAAITRAKEKTAVQLCKQKIANHGLEMKLIDAEYTFDEGKLLFYFTADGRVDFRELVKDLASEFHTRIELRQVGVRDETKILGGIGICGRVLCCHSYLSDFVPVSIKMAKEQNLSLNPTKISGTCGRLMCCLKNEQETYEELNRHLPGVNDEIITVDGVSGKVESINVLRQTVRLLIVDKAGDKEIVEIPASQVASIKERSKKKKGNKYIPYVSEEELKALEDEKAATAVENDTEGIKEKSKERSGDSPVKGQGHFKDKRRDQAGRDHRGRDQNRDHHGRDQGRERPEAPRKDAGKVRENRKNFRPRRDKNKNKNGEK